jgi:CheY-like chemotaxis protein
LRLLDRGAVPDLILLDLLRPDVDGWRVLDRFRDGPHGSIPIVVMTGVDLPDGWTALHGCAGVLRKPFGEDVLLAELRRVLRPV